MTTKTNASQSVSFFSLPVETTAPTMSPMVALSFARELTDLARKADRRSNQASNQQSAKTA